MRLVHLKFPVLLIPLNTSGTTNPLVVLLPGQVGLAKVVQSNIQFLDPKFHMWCTRINNWVVCKTYTKSLHAQPNFHISENVYGDKSIGLPRIVILQSEQMSLRHFRGEGPASCRFPKHVFRLQAIRAHRVGYAPFLQISHVYLLHAGCFLLNQKTQKFRHYPRMCCSEAFASYLLIIVGWLHATIVPLHIAMLSAAALTVYNTLSEYQSRAYIATEEHLFESIHEKDRFQKRWMSCFPPHTHAKAFSTYCFRKLSIPQYQLHNKYVDRSAPQYLPRNILIWKSCLFN